MSPALKYWDATTSSWKLGAVGLPSGQVWQQVIGDGLNTSFTVTHGFGTRSVYVSVYRNSPPYEEVEADVERTDTSSVTVRTYPTVPGVSEFIAVVASAGTQATANITMDSWHVVGNPGEPAFQNSWTAVTAAQTPRFRKYPDGRVRLSGALKSGTMTQTAFTLPVGYRPVTTQDFATMSNDAFGHTYIASNGIVVPQGGTNASVYLDVIEFDTESVLQTASVAAQPLEPWHVVGAVGEPAFQNSWINTADATDATAAFRKYPDGRVRLRGGVSTGTVGSPMFFLPVGYRPPAVVIFSVPAGGTTPSAACRVNPANGAVSLDAPGTNAYVYLDGIEFDTETVAAYASGIIGPPRVTALPANPVDGQECYFVADAANGVLWHLRYNAGSASAYKWEVVGGGDLASQVDADDGTTSTASYVTLATAGPSVSLPLAGDYDIGTGFQGYHSAASAWALYMSYDIGATGASDSDSTQSGSNQSVVGQDSNSRWRRKTGLGAVVLTSKYKIATAGTGQFGKRWLRARPVRVG